MLGISCFTRAPICYLLAGVVAVCAAATCAAQSEPVLTGTPPTSATAGNTYSFQPGADNTAGHPVEHFGIHNQPTWATFNPETGLLTGAPTSAQVGTYSDISIYGSDGREWASTSTFSITVDPAGTPPSNSGSVNLDWTTPTENTDGTELTDLAGYRLYYGTSVSNLSTTVQIPGASMTAYTLHNLAAATYYFAIMAYTNTGVESALSQVVSATVN
jgi:hypothetical protein